MKVIFCITRHLQSDVEFESLQMIPSSKDLGRKCVQVWRIENTIPAQCLDVHGVTSSTKYVSYPLMQEVPLRSRTEI